MFLEERDIDLSLINWLQFEELCYDLLIASGYHSLEWRQGGSDQGRDLEARLYLPNSLVEVQSEKWFIECKHLSKSIGIEDISDKIDWAKAFEPEHFILICSSYLAPGTRTWLEQIKSKLPFKIHVIDGKKLRLKLLEFPDLISKYFYSESTSIIRGLQKQWVHHNILPDAASFYSIYKDVDVTTLSGTDLAFLLMLNNELDEKIDEYCESEGTERVNENKLLLALRKHKNHGFPLFTENEIAEYRLDIGTNFCRSTIKQKPGDLVMFLVHEQINHNQFLDVLLKKELRTLEVRISLRE